MCFFLTSRRGIPGTRGALRKGQERLNVEMPSVGTRRRSAQKAGAPERGNGTGTSGGLLSTVTGGSGNFGLDLYRVYCVALCKEIGCAALSQLARPCRP